MPCNNGEKKETEREYEAHSRDDNGDREKNDGAESDDGARDAAARSSAPIQTDGNGEGARTDASLDTRSRCRVAIRAPGDDAQRPIVAFLFLFFLRLRLLIVIWAKTKNRSEIRHREHVPTC